MTSVHQILPWELDERTHSASLGPATQQKPEDDKLARRDLVQEALLHPQKNKGQAFNMVGAINSSSETLPEAAKVKKS